MRVRSVLLIDDSPEDNFIHARQLRKHYPGCEVAYATNGQLALDLLRDPAREGKPPFDLICLDVNMPVLDGWGFLERYDELPAGLRAEKLCLMVSTALPREAANLADASPSVDFFLSKPFDCVLLDTELLVKR